jgi:F0F1-type ATP synthase membrane subunit c/vacuolar-type H+-ATPase subunit K
MANIPQEQVAPQKSTWFILWVAFVGMVFSYGLIGFFIGKPTRAGANDVFQLVLGALSVLQLIAAVIWMQVKTRVPSTQLFVGSASKEPVQEPMEFQTNSIIAMALAEACSLYGLMLLIMGAPITTYALFAAGALIVSVGFILPRGIAYWTAYEAQQKAEKEPSPFSSYKM